MINNRNELLRIVQESLACVLDQEEDIEIITEDEIDPKIANSITREMESKGYFYAAKGHRIVLQKMDKLDRFFDFLFLGGLFKLSVWKEIIEPRREGYYRIK